SAGHRPRPDGIHLRVHDERGRKGRPAANAQHAEREPRLDLCVAVLVHAAPAVIAQAAELTPLPGPDEPSERGPASAEVVGDEEEATGYASGVRDGQRDGKQLAGGGRPRNVAGDLDTAERTRGEDA